MAKTTQMTPGAGRSHPVGVTFAGTLAASYQLCRDLHRRHGRSYYLATRFLPADRRWHVHALYGFTRYTDDIVDATNGPERELRLSQWIGQFEAAMAGPPEASAAPAEVSVLPALRHTVEVCGLDRRDLDDFLRSMRLDLTVTRYETYEDVLEYMAGSAAAIGSLVLPILGASDLAAAREPARQLGLAFQLTNFIRDVGEDIDRGRIYLPLEDLARFGVSAGDLRAKVATPAVRALIAFEVARAQAHYRAAVPGIAWLEPVSRRCVRAAYLVYGGILDEVVRAGYDVFVRRARVRTTRRLALAARCLLGQRAVGVPGRRPDAERKPVP